MNKPNLVSLVFSRLCLLTLAGAWGTAWAAAAPVAAPAAAPAGTAGQMQLQLTPEAIAKGTQMIEVNMARWFFGATLIQQDKNGALTRIVFQNRADSPYSLLLDDDATASLKLPAGETRVVIDIGGTKTTTRFGFFCFSAAGSVDLYSSNASDLVKTLDPADTKVWTPVNAHADLTARTSVDLSLRGLEARYVMVVFHLTQPGEIGPVALFGNADVSSLADIAPDQEEKKDPNKKAAVVNQNDLIEFDYANRAFGSKVTHVAGGDVKDAQAVLSSDPTKKLVLGDNTTQTAPGQPTKLTNVFVVDMGKERDINKVGLLFNTGGPGKFEFYFLNALPTEDAAAKTASLQDARQAQPILLAAMSGSLAEALILAQVAPDLGGVSTVQYLPDNFFDQNKPGITQNVTTDSTRVAQTFDNNLKFRFALVRWVPNSPNQPPVEILRVNLIGKVPPDNFFAASKKGSEAASLPNSAAGVVTPTPGLTAPAGSTPAASTSTSSATSAATSAATGESAATSSATGSGAATGAGGGGTGAGGGGTGGGGGSPPEPPPPPQPTNPVSP